MEWLLSNQMIRLLRFVEYADARSSSGRVASELGNVWRFLNWGLPPNGELLLVYLNIKNILFCCNTGNGMGIVYCCFQFGQVP